MAFAFLRQLVLIGLADIKRYGATVQFQGRREPGGKSFPAGPRRSPTLAFQVAADPISDECIAPYRRKPLLTTLTGQPAIKALMFVTVVFIRLQA
jgi:hypothetical protein